MFEDKLNEHIKPKLLLADDSVTIRKVVELTFSDEGIEVTTVSDAAAAMQKFVEIQPDIVLVDVGMTETSGYRICEMIKQDEATKHIPVLLLVGSFEPFDQDEAERVMCDGFLTKPFHSIRDLVNRVWDLLGRERRAAAKSAETADIENLYQSSLMETAKLEDFDTAEDIFGDSGMDDEMIEASYPAESANGEAVDLSTHERGRETKEFDWSMESMVTEVPEAEPEQQAEQEPEPDHWHEPEQESQPEHEDMSEPEQEPDFQSEHVPTPAFEPKFVFDESGEAEPPEHESFDQPEHGGMATVKDIEVPPQDAKPDEPSPELITLLAQRIVERLSDRVIREIAQDAVPRIAEKLIREALEEDNKG